jgi:hypothetical protein
VSSSHTHTHTDIQAPGLSMNVNSYCSFMVSGRKIARNVMAMATGEAPAAEVAVTELPEIVKAVQEAVRI